MAEGYKAYLQSEGWKAKREKMLAQAEYRCNVCGSTEDLCVHHLSYDSLKWDKPGTESESHLIVLCSNCHKLIHESLERNKYAVEKLTERYNGLLEQARIDCMEEATAIVAHMYREFLKMAKTQNWNLKTPIANGKHSFAFRKIESGFQNAMPFFLDREHEMQVVHDGAEIIREKQRRLPK